jgi:FdhD protein
VGFYKRLETLQLLETAVAETDLKLQALLNRAESEGIARALPFEESEKILFTNLNTAQDLSAIDPNRFDDTISLKRFHRSSGLAEADDFVAAEEPLEVRVNGQSVSVMMRTPGHDEELATGFLFTESVIQSTADIREIKHLDDVDRSSSGNTLEIELESEPDLTDLTRHVFTSSSCGVCGKATIDSVFQQFPPIQEAKSVSPDLILALPDRLRAAQKTFDRTGGLHASALFSQEGKLLVLREDVGRHNALDKVIGFGLQGKINFSEVVLLVSGRISFELMQKSLSVGIPTVAGISAPSSLAVTLANESGQTLVGFLRGEGFNLYSGSLG